MSRGRGEGMRDGQYLDQTRKPPLPQRHSYRRRDEQHGRTGYVCPTGGAAIAVLVVYVDVTVELADSDN